MSLVIEKKEYSFTSRAEHLHAPGQRASERKIKLLIMISSLCGGVCGGDGNGNGGGGGAAADDDDSSRATC